MGFRRSQLVTQLHNRGLLTKNQKKEGKKKEKKRHAGRAEKEIDALHGRPLFVFRIDAQPLAGVDDFFSIAATVIAPPTPQVLPGFATVLTTSHKKKKWKH